MNAEYLNRLNRLADPKTIQRKVDYIRYNLGKYIPQSNLNKLTILEIGPGLGELLKYLNSKKITDIDIADNDKSVLAFLKQNYKIQKSILLTNISKQEKELRKYDLIVMIQVLEHIPVTVQQDLLRILFNHLNEDGHLVIVVPNASNPLGMVERYADFQHTIAFTEQSLQDLVNGADLKNATVEIKGYKIPAYELINKVRIVFQKVLHTILLGLLIINGGIYFKTMTPNIMLVIKKNK